jgi:hypothetical protein
VGAVGLACVGILVERVGGLGLEGHEGGGGRAEVLLALGDGDGRVGEGGRVHAPGGGVEWSGVTGLVNVATIDVWIGAGIHADERGGILDVLVLTKESHWQGRAGAGRSSCAPCSKYVSLNSRRKCSKAGKQLIFRLWGPARLDPGSD